MSGFNLQISAAIFFPPRQINQTYPDGLLLPYLAVAAHLVTLAEALLLSGAQGVPQHDVITEGHMHAPVCLRLAWKRTWNDAQLQNNRCDQRFRQNNNKKTVTSRNVPVRQTFNLKGANLPAGFKKHHKKQDKAVPPPSHLTANPPHSKLFIHLREDESFQKMQCSAENELGPRSGVCALESTGFSGSIPYNSL